MATSIRRIYFNPLLIASAVFIMVNTGLYVVIARPTAAENLTFDVPAAPTVEIAEVPKSDTVSTTLTGEWSSANGIVMQSAPLGQDMLYGTGLIAEEFTVDIDIALPTDVPDAGGGLLFHMANRDDFAQSYMVRLMDGGRSVLWGYFDETNTFIGEGSVPINPAQVNTLRLIVKDKVYTIQVNGITAAQNLPLRQLSGSLGGYLAYLSFRGPVIFSNFKLLLTSS